MRICVFGGAGYVGSKLCIQLMQNGHEVVIYDLRQPEWLVDYAAIGRSYSIKADIRDLPKAKEALRGCDAVIHLAAVSNDPSFDLDPALGKSINLDSFLPTVEAAKEAKVKRFIFASSSSVYGVREEKDVVETTPLTPLTDYSKFKAECERILLENKGNMEAVVVRPATVSGYSPALRLDLLVHLLTISALKHGVIKVFGGSQYRPNIFIDDLCDAYELLLTAKNVDSEIFNCGFTNLTILETAQMVRNVIGQYIGIEVTESTDPRSYHICSQKIATKLGFMPYRPVGAAIIQIKDAWHRGDIGDPDDAKYHRIRGMKEMFGG